MKIVWITVVIALLVGLGLYLHSPSAAEKETKPVVLEAIGAISESWDGRQLREHAEPGLIKAMESQGQSPDDLMKIYSVLGKLKQQPVCEAAAPVNSMKNGEQRTTISYECSAEYEKAPAKISITLAKAESGKKWLIYYINIHSDLFSEVIE